MVDKALEELGYDYLLVPLNRDGVVQLGFRCVHAGKLGRDFFTFIMYVLMTGKWLHLITGVKITKDERNFFISNEGTHGTSGWMT